MFGPCQITLFPVQAPESGAITCGENGDFKRTLYWEKHSIERGTVPEKPANTGCQLYLLGYVMHGYQSPQEVFLVSLGSLYVRDHPDMHVKWKGLDSKAAAASTESMHSTKVRVGVSVASQGFRVGSPSTHWHNWLVRVSQVYLICVSPYPPIFSSFHCGEKRQSCSCPAHVTWLPTTVWGCRYLT